MGGGSTDVTAVAAPNPLMKERSTTINFSSGGGLAKAVNAVQNGVPYVMLQMNFPVYEGTQMTLRTWTSQLQNSDGVLVFKTSLNDYSSWTSTEDNVMRLSFYSDSSNTFTFSGKDPAEAGNISGTFLKSGNIHYLNIELLQKVQLAVWGSLREKVPLSIMMNGTVIQEYSIFE